MPASNVFRLCQWNAYDCLSVRPYIALAQSSYQLSIFIILDQIFRLFFHHSLSLLSSLSALTHPSLGILIISPALLCSFFIRSSGFSFITLSAFSHLSQLSLILLSEFSLLSPALLCSFFIRHTKPKILRLVFKMSRFCQFQVRSPEQSQSQMDLADPLFSYRPPTHSSYT